tara:strand:- start:155 stop:538 length:384 start_codon:yes stop_codon:yes gene_type:complete
VAGSAANAGGQVTYSSVPLTNVPGAQGPDVPTPGRVARKTTHGASIPRSTAEADDTALMSQDQTSAPAITINGQLYSTVPGRSFILVDGRRYHEGERLAAGPAVEQIEPSGAVLRYQGQRYRVDGPG